MPSLLTQPERSPSPHRSASGARRLPELELGLELDRERLRALFQPCEERRRLQQLLQLDEELVLARLADECEHLDHRWLAHSERTGELHLAYAQPIRWSQEALGCSIVQLRHLAGPGLEERTAQLRRLLERVRRRTPGALVTARIPLAEVSLNQRLSSVGFRWVGAELTGVISLETAPPLELPGELRCTLLDTSSLDAVQEIAAHAHTQNHFFCDPMLPTDFARRIFAAQVRRSLKSSRTRCIGIFEGKQLLGFIFSNLVQSFERYGGPRLANLDFICVDPQVQRRGLGDQLNRAALSWLYEQGIRRVSVRTMVNNFRAQAILRRVGWRPALSESVFHASL